MANLSAAGLSSQDIGTLRRHGFGKWAPPPPLELLVGGRRQARARWPNPSDFGRGTQRRGCVNMKSAGKNRSSSFVLTSRRPTRWNASIAAAAGGGEKIWIDGVLSQDWVWTYNSVSSVDAFSGVVQLGDEEVVQIGKTGTSDTFFFFENILEEIDEPGEYFVDSAAKTLYIYPPTEFDSARITVTVLREPMIVINGSIDVIIQGLTLDHGRGHGIEVKGCDRCKFESLDVKNFGGVAIKVTGGKQVSIRKSHIHEIGQTAIQLRGGTFPPSTDAGNMEIGGHIVEDCHIERWGYWQKVYTSAVDLQGTANTVRHCEIHDAQHGAVILRGNDHIIEYNEFYDVMQYFHDLGVVYYNTGKDPFQRGHAIDNNFFHSITKQNKAYGIYVDNGGVGPRSIKKNIFYKFGSAAKPLNGAIFGNGFSGSRTENNYFVDCRVDWMDSMFMNPTGWAKHWAQEYMEAWGAEFARRSPSQLQAWFSRYPDMATARDENQTNPISNTFVGNVQYNPTVARNYAPSTWIKYGSLDSVQVSHNWLTGFENPGFAELSSTVMDFHLANDAVERHIPGWEHIEWDDMGLREPVGPDHVTQSRRRVPPMRLPCAAAETAHAEPAGTCQRVYFGEACTPACSGPYVASPASLACTTPGAELRYECTEAATA